jgi:hypothetical protein
MCGCDMGAPPADRRLFRGQADAGEADRRRSMTGASASRNTEDVGHHRRDFRVAALAPEASDTADRDLKFVTIIEFQPDFQGIAIVTAPPPPSAAAPAPPKVVEG